MGSLTEPRSFPALAVMSRIQTARGNIAAAHRAAQEHERLDHLSDLELEDLGLAREDLPRFVYDKHFG